MQKVELYYNTVDAKWDMEKYIKNGWRVHTCTMGCYEAGYGHGENILVVYER